MSLLVVLSMDTTGMIGSLTTIVLMDGHSITVTSLFSSSKYSLYRIAFISWSISKYVSSSNIWDTKPMMLTMLSQLWHMCKSISNPLLFNTKLEQVSKFTMHLPCNSKMPIPKLNTNNILPSNNINNHNRCINHLLNNTIHNNQYMTNMDSRFNINNLLLKLLSIMKK